MEFMEPEFNQTVQELSNFEKSMDSRTKEFASIPKEFDDLVPAAREKAIQEAKKRAIDSTASFFEKKHSEVSEKLGRINNLIAKTIYPLRSSIVGSDVASGEAQFRSALDLVNTKKAQLILSELRYAAAGGRIDFVFAVYELMKGDDRLSNDFKNEVCNIIDTLPASKNFNLLLNAKNNLEEIGNQISFYKRQMSSGNLPGNYAVNKGIRDARGIRTNLK